PPGAAAADETSRHPPAAPRRAANPSNGPRPHDPTNTTGNETRNPSTEPGASGVTAAEEIPVQPPAPHPDTPPHDPQRPYQGEPIPAGQSPPPHDDARGPIAVELRRRLARLFEEIDDIDRRWDGTPPPDARWMTEVPLALSTEQTPEALTAAADAL